MERLTLIANLVFEDFEDMPISKLISNAYTDDIRVYFAGGNAMSKEFFNTIEDKSIPTIIFCDVVPDNIDTCNKYAYICRQASKVITLFYVIPIFCIEYSFMKMFSINTGTESGYYNAVCRGEVSRELLNGKSFEKLCKMALNEKSKRCVRNKWNKRRSNQFYVGDCLCSTVENMVGIEHVTLCVNYKYQDKCTDMVVGTGVFYSKGLKKEYRLSYQEVAIMEILINKFRQHDELCGKYLENGIDVKVFSRKIVSDAIECMEQCYFKEIMTNIIGYLL